MLRNINKTLPLRMECNAAVSAIRRDINNEVLVVSSTLGDRLTILSYNRRLKSRTTNSAPIPQSQRRKYEPVAITEVSKKTQIRGQTPESPPNKPPSIKALKPRPKANIAPELMITTTAANKKYFL
ncbi:hypothetical protein ANAPH2_01457 [Anaplasma phagocytophilum]|nr:hypothetical protein ANAPH2_01457 [Anaplasma phagocytophilum]